MNKQFTIIISITTALLVSLLVAISFFRSQEKINQSTHSTVAPTSVPINRGSSPTSVGTHYVVPTPMMPVDKRDASFKLQGTLPYNSDALAIEYSTLSDKFYIEQKNAKADEEFQAFLEKNGLKEMYDKYPDLFVVKSTNIKNLIDQENRNLLDDSELSVEFATSPVPTLISQKPSTYAEQRNNNQLNAFESFTRSVFSFNKIVPTSTPQKILPNLVFTSDAPESTSQKSTTYKQSPYIQPLSPAYKQNVQYDWGPYSCFNPPGQQPGAKAIQAYINAHWGGGTGYIGNCTPKDGKFSIHAEGRAVDSYFYVGDKMQQGNAAFGWLLTNAQNIGIQYIKYWRVQWAAGKLGLHCVTDARDQAVHSTHIHYELNWAGAKQQTPYFTQGINKPSTITINQDVCPIVK